MIDQLRAHGKSGEVGKLNRFEFLDKFDSTLEKACRIASLKDPNDSTKTLYGQDAWLVLIRFLLSYKVISVNKLLEKPKLPEANGMRTLVEQQNARVALSEFEKNKEGAPLL